MPNKIFQIGYSKTGTVSLYRFFIMNGVPSVHYDYGNLAQRIVESVVTGKPPFDDYKNVTAFFDMQAWIRRGAPEGFAYFDKLDELYPESKFILNVRPAERWLASVRGHWHNDINLLSAMKRNLGVDEAGLLERRERHHNRVIDYFADRPADLLVFDIETNGGAELCKFFRDWFPRMDPSKWRHFNKTSRKNRFRIGQDRGSMRVRSKVHYSSRRRH